MIFQKNQKMEIALFLPYGINAVKKQIKTRTKINIFYYRQTQNNYEDT
jgi:hypothetical protein